MDEPILARRVTIDEYLEHCTGKTVVLQIIWRKSVQVIWRMRLSL
jgi:hypothetical protein